MSDISGTKAPPGIGDGPGTPDFNVRLLDSIRLLQTRFIAGHDLREIFNQFILEVLRLTSSEYAFVGEVLHAPDGHPYLKIHDISHIARDESTRAFFEGHAPAGAEFHNLQNLFGRAILDRAPVIANLPKQDPRWGGRQPHGHPPMHSFLGLPLMLEGEAIGLVGLANRPEGYDEELVTALEPVLTSCAAILESHRNVRRRVRAEEELSRSGRLFRALVEKSTEATVVLGADLVLKYASPSCLPILGYAPEEIIAVQRFSLVVPEDRDAVSAGFARLLDGLAREDVMEFRVRRKDGRVIWLESHLTAHLDDPAIGGLVSIFRDITERKASELALHQAEERLQLAVEAGGLGTWYCDLPLDRIQMNLRCRELFGFGASEEVDFAKFYGRLHPEDLAATRQAVDSAVAEGRPYDTYYRVVAPDDPEPRWIRAIGKVVPGGEESTGRFIGVCIDVSESRRREDLMRQSQKMEAIGRLAGGIAHDFNNLLTAINGYSEMALGDAPEGHPLRPPLEEIRRSGERAAALTQQLLAYGRKQMLVPRVMELNELVRDTERMLTRLIGEDVRVDLGLGGGAGLVKVDPVQFQQALVNLALNGRDAMPGGGTLSFRTSEVVLSREDLPPDLPPGRYASVEVADTGTGIDAAVLPKIFEPFFTTKPVGKGTGLGLSMVYGMVRQSGGHIAVESRPGSGSRFTILLPAAAREPAAAPPRAPTGVRGPQGRGTLLLVEDERTVLNFLSLTLRSQGFEVVAFDRGEDALEWILAREAPPLLLLTDVVMEGLSGPALAAEAQARHPGLKVIFMSGYTDDEMLKYGVRENQVPFLQKPFGLPALLAKIREVLEPARAP